MTNPNMHTENMDEEGTITDGGELSATTYYSPLVGIMDADGYLRVVCDAPGHYTETRVDHATLIAAGWTPPTASPENAESTHQEPKSESEADERLTSRDSLCSLEL
jgi:hypothetical protein